MISIENGGWGMEGEDINKANLFLQGKGRNRIQILRNLHEQCRPEARGVKKEQERVSPAMEGLDQIKLDGVDVIGTNVDLIG